MNGDPHTLVLAIDGGGTRCRIAACQDGQTSTVETGAANASTDFDGTVRQILEGLQALGQHMNQTVDQLTAAPTFIGLAGVVSTKIADRLRAPSTPRTAASRSSAIRTC